MAGNTGERVSDRTPARGGPFLPTILALLSCLWGAPVLDGKVPPVPAPSTEPGAEILRDPFNGEHSGPAHVYRVIFARDGRYFLAAGDAGGRSPVRIYNAHTGKLVCRFLPEENIGWTGARFSPDATTVLSWGSSSPTLYVWETATARQLLRLAGQQQHITYADFSPDGKQIIATAADRNLRLWDVRTGKQLWVGPGHTAESAACFAPDGKHIVSYGGDGTIRGWDSASGKELWQHAGQARDRQPGLFHISPGCFTPDGTSVVSFADDGSIRLWDVAGGKPVATLVGAPGTHGAAFLPDGQQLVSWGRDKKLHVWDLPSRKAVRTFDLGQDLQHEPDNVIVSPNARLFLTGHTNQTVRIWSLFSGKELHRFATAPYTGMRSLAFSPDSRCAAAGSFRGWVYLWHLPGGVCRTE